MKLELSFIFIIGITTVLSRDLTDTDLLKSIIRTKRHSGELKLAEYRTRISDICNSIDCSYADIMRYGRRKRQTEDTQVRQSRSYMYQAYMTCCPER